MKYISLYLCVFFLSPVVEDSPGVRQIWILCQGFGNGPLGIVDEQNWLEKARFWKTSSVRTRRFVPTNLSKHKSALICVNLCLRRNTFFYKTNLILFYFGVK